MDCTAGGYRSEEGRVSWSVAGNNYTELLDVGRECGRVDSSSMDSVMSELDKGYLGGGCLSSVGEEEASDLLKTLSPIPRSPLSLATAKTWRGHPMKLRYVCVS